jgi:hypothetical protein
MRSGVGVRWLSSGCTASAQAKIPPLIIPRAIVDGLVRFVYRVTDHRLSSKFVTTTVIPLSSISGLAGKRS